MDNVSPWDNPHTSLLQTIPDYSMSRMFTTYGTVRGTPVAEKWYPGGVFLIVNRRPALLDSRKAA